MLSEHSLARCQVDPDEDCYHGTELAISVSEGRNGVDGAGAVQAHGDRDKAWENFWLKQGMSRDLVRFWQQHEWSWEIALSQDDLRLCIDKRGFLLGDLAAAGRSIKF